jgi:hypothetical protein
MEVPSKRPIAARIEVLVFGIHRPPSRLCSSSTPTWNTVIHCKTFTYSPCSSCSGLLRKLNNSFSAAVAPFVEDTGEAPSCCLETSQKTNGTLEHVKKTKDLNRNTTGTPTGTPNGPVALQNRASLHVPGDLRVLVLAPTTPFSIGPFVADLKSSSRFSGFQSESSKLRLISLRVLAFRA